MVSNGSAPGSYVKQLDSKPINNRLELSKWRCQTQKSQLDNATYVEDSIDDEDYGEFESKGESLLKLVEPELENLGENWLAALKDHALLSLPPGKTIFFYLISLGALYKKVIAVKFYDATNISRMKDSDSQTFLSRYTFNVFKI